MNKKIVIVTLAVAFFALSGAAVHAKPTIDEQRAALIKQDKERVSRAMPPFTAWKPGTEAPVAKVSNEKKLPPKQISLSPAITYSTATPTEIAAYKKAQRERVSRAMPPFTAWKPGAEVPVAKVSNEQKLPPSQVLQRPALKRTAAKQAEIDAYLKAQGERASRGHPPMKPWDGK